MEQNCCTCMGTCCHTGPHYFCNDHGGTHRRYNPETYVVPPCPSCAALRAEMERKWGQYKQIIDDVFDGCECSPKCDSHAHEEDCAAVNGPVAVRKLRARVAVLEKVVEAVKHGHATRHDTTAAMEKCPLCAALDAAKEGE